MAEVTLTNVVKRYGKSEVVHRINLEIADLEFVVFVGPSGCGKSTTLRMIAGLETVSEGDIRIGGRRVNDVAPKDRDVAMVFQNYALYPHMNVYNNMAFGLKLRKFSASEIRRRVGEAAEVLGLSELLKRKPFELSGGQRQRVAMGRAIVRNPSVFLFDEPLSNLDAKLRNQMRAEIKRLHKRVGTTIVYVTHDQVEAMTLADRIVVMRGGVIEQVGNPLDLYRKPVNTFVAGFIGNPPMNLISGRIASSGDSLVFQGQGGFQAPIPPGARTLLFSGPSPPVAAVMGLRPEDITLDVGDIRFSSVWKTRAMIEFVEPLGSETYFHADAGGVKLMGKADGSRLVSAGDVVPMVFNLDHLHLFDAETRLSLY